MHCAMAALGLFAAKLLVDVILPLWVDTGNRIVAALNSASFQVAATMRLNLGRAALRRLVAALLWVTHAGRASAG